MKGPTLRRIAAALLVTSVLSACVKPPMLPPEDRKEICRVAVQETFETPVFHPPPFYETPGGPVAGAAGGALAGAGAGAYVGLYLWPAIIVTAPVGTVIGAIHGAECAAAGQSHPTAEADFERIFRLAYSGKLKQAMEAELNTPRDGCERASPAASPDIAPDTVIEIQGVDVYMGCPVREQPYWIKIEWRVRSTRGKGELARITTECYQTSFLDHEAWFADPEKARKEIEGVLVKAGQLIAAALVSPEGSLEKPIPCALRSTETGEIVERK